MDSWINYKVINEQLFFNQKRKKTFVTVNYDMHFMVKPDSAIDKVFKTMTAAEPNTLHTTCETELTHLLTILAVAFTSAGPDGFFLKRNRRDVFFWRKYFCSAMLSSAFTINTTTEWQIFHEIPF